MKQPHAVPIQPVVKEPRESLAMVLLGGAAVIGIAISLFLIFWALG